MVMTVPCSGPIGTQWREPFTRFDFRIAKELPGRFEAVLGLDNLFDRQIADWPGFTGRHIDTSIFWRADAR
jgi:hypothetical protein